MATEEASTEEAPTEAPTESPAGALTLHQAADRIGVHYMTVYRWVRTGRIPAHRVGAEWRVEAADVERARVRGRGPAAAGVRGRPLARKAAADRLRARLVVGDEAGAWAVLEEVLAAGASPADVYLEVITPALVAIGDGWVAGTVTVAEEHRAAVVASRVVGRMGPQFARPGRKRGTVVIGGPAGEEHTLPGSLLADVLRGAGFDVVDLGANTPPVSFVESASQATRLVAVIVGVSNLGNDAAVAATTDALRAGGIDAPVLVGGAAIEDAEHARRLGADAWTGRDARAALVSVEALSPQG